MPATGIADGDTVRFRPDHPDPLFMLTRQGRPPRFNPDNGTIAVRYEGIDALEKEAKEPFASAATAANLTGLGLASPTDEAPGYILSRIIDSNGRPISWVFTGTPPATDGASVFLDVAWMKMSVNFQLLAAGFVYPIFYDTLFGDLRAELTAAVVAARRGQRHLAE